jgi:DNA-directed RNA polymerase specialized sigma24 family protein
VRKMIEEHHGRILYYARRLIWRAEAAEDIPQRSIDARAIVDEVARQACLRPEEKPEELSYRLWFYALARQDLERRRKEFRDQTEMTVPLAAVVDFPEAADEALSNTTEPLAPASGEFADIIADSHALPPDVAASEADLLDHLHQVTKEWPRRESSIFELHFVEGFEPEEVAMIEGVKTSEIEKLIPQVQARLRGALTEALESKVSERKRDGRGRLEGLR